MRTVLFALGTAVFLTAGLPPGAFGFETALKYEKSRDNQIVGTFFPSGFGYTQAGDAKPAGDWKLPALNAEKPLYALLTFGDRKHLVVLDAKKSGEKIYSRLWFDRDGDGDLAEEAPVESAPRPGVEAPPGYMYVQFPLIDATIMAGGAELPYCFQPQISGMMPGAAAPRLNITLAYMVPCAYSGTLALGGQEYSFWLSDRNGNGRFDDYAEIRAMGQMAMGPAPLSVEGDYIFLTDRPKKETAIVQPSDAQPLGNYLLLGSQIFEVKIDLPKGKMIFTEMKTGLGSLTLPVKTDRISLYSETGPKVVTAYKPSGDALMLPPGNYKLLSYQVFRKDGQGDLWRLSASGSGESPMVTVSPGGKASFNVCEPFTPVVALPSTGSAAVPKSGSLPLQFSVAGAGKEIVTEITHLEGTATNLPLSTTRGRETRPKEPAYTIVKADGEIVARGSFEYG